MSERNPEIEEIEIESVADLDEQMVYRLSGCDPAMIRKSLQSAFADFARVTACFTTEREFWTKDGELVYPVAPKLSGMYVDSICAVWLDGRRLSRPEQYFTGVICGTPTVRLVCDAGGAFSSRYALTRPDGSMNPIATRVAVERRAFEPQRLRVRTVELPRTGSEKAPRWFLDKYGEAVVAGAFVRLFGMTGKAWSDPAQAQSELIRYENFTTKARLDSLAEDVSPVGNGHIDAIDTSGLL